MRRWAEAIHGPWDKSQERYADGTTSDDALAEWNATHSSPLPTDEDAHEADRPDRAAGGLIAAGDRLPLRESMFCYPFPVSHELDEIIAAYAEEHGMTKEQAIQATTELWHALNSLESKEGQTND